MSAPFVSRDPATGLVGFGPGRAAPSSAGLPAPDEPPAAYNLSALQDYVAGLASGGSAAAAEAFVHGTGVAAGGAYWGAVFSPLQNRVYFVPYGQSSSNTWHYVDCATGGVVGYVSPNVAAPGSVVANAYSGGVYAPALNRIYFAPNTQGAQATWHYVDCATGAVVGYASPNVAAPGSVVVSAYQGGAYCPLRDRVYFAPRNQGSQAVWHYVDCAAGGTIVAYTSPVVAAPGSIAVANAYLGGVYAPKLGRIYFAPQAQAPLASWHYIDCAAGEAVAYPAGAGAVSGAYAGGAFAPTLNRIYFAPAAQAIQAEWHYIDGVTGLPVAYAPGSAATAVAVNASSYGAVYVPPLDRIYFVPYGQASQASWLYVDGRTGIPTPYLAEVTAVAGSYLGGAYAPSLGRVYFAPFSQGVQTAWHFVANLGDAPSGMALAANSPFNTF